MEFFELAKTLTADVAIIALFTWWVVVYNPRKEQRNLEAMQEVARAHALEMENLQVNMTNVLASQHAALKGEIVELRMEVRASHGGPPLHGDD